MNLGKKIQTYRLEHHWTQEELGEKMNLSNKTIHAYEKNERTPDIYKIRELATIFGIPVATFLDERKIQPSGTVFRKWNWELKWTFENIIYQKTRVRVNIRLDFDEETNEHLYVFYENFEELSDEEWKKLENAGLDMDNDDLDQNLLQMYLNTEEFVWVSIDPVKSTEFIIIMEIIQSTTHHLNPNGF